MSESFAYRSSELCIAMGENKYEPLSRFVQDYKGPLILYSRHSLKRRVAAYKKAFDGFQIHFAMKANHNPELLNFLREQGIGLDVVSIGEVDLGLKCQYKPEQIIFSGVGKTISEIKRALSLEVSQINVESPQELARIAQVAKSLKKKAKVSFRLNPDVNAKTHPYIATGFRENKFGMDSSFLPELIGILKANTDCLSLVGLTFHIGSQLFDLDAWTNSLDKLLEVYASLKAQGFPVQRLDVGGGVGIHYANGDENAEEKFLVEYGGLARTKLKNTGCVLQCEPGRFLVARSAVLITQIQYTKVTPFKKFVIVDSGMNHLIRPALYEAYHRILPLKTFSERRMEVCDIVGPICESADFFAKSRPIPECRQDEFLAVMDVGAYGSVMASDYNCQARCVEVFA